MAMMKIGPVLIKEVFMRKYIALSGIAVCLVLALVMGCADTNSPEACKYATTVNLDHGNYDAVLQSPCATPMHLGAAYFGKAGYSVTTVVNTLISAQTTSASSDKALRQYMNILTGKVTPKTIAFLDDSQAKYLSVPPSSDLYKSAQFDLSIVLAIKSVALLKSVVDAAGVGSLSTCNINGNTIPDEADAASCALLVSGTTLTGGACPAPLATAATYTTVDITFSSVSGTYKGLTATMTGAPGACPSDYKKLLYLNTTDSKYYAATTSGTCQASDLQMWPCPVTSQIDLVNTVQASIDGTLGALNIALTGTTSTDVKQSVEDIKIQACGGTLTSTCTAATLADYLQTHL
jgi:hypothetical protein